MELSALSHSAARSQIQSALAHGWLRIANPPAPPSRLPIPLDAGETAAISLALSVAADLILIDEKRGRAAARAAGLHVGGLLGELLHAKRQGCLPSLRPEIVRLHRKDSMSYKTLNGARVGDIYMSLIHTCELNQVNPFEYLVALQEHSRQVVKDPSRWLPWNHTEALAPADTG